jgi:hypothetical protein
MDAGPCLLIRGGDELGVVTHDAHEDAGAWNVGNLEPAPAFGRVLRLLEHEQEVLAQLLQLEQAPGDSGEQAVEAARLRLEAEMVQGAILMPGVLLVRLDKARVYRVGELHVEGLKVYRR